MDSMAQFYDIQRFTVHWIDIDIDISIYSRTDEFLYAHRFWRHLATIIFATAFLWNLSDSSVQFESWMRGYNVSHVTYHMFKSEPVGIVFVHHLMSPDLESFHRQTRSRGQVQIFGRRCGCRRPRDCSQRLSKNHSMKPVPINSAKHTAYKKFDLFDIYRSFPVHVGCRMKEVPICLRGSFSVVFLLDRKSLLLPLWCGARLLCGSCNGRSEIDWANLFGRHEQVADSWRPEACDFAVPCLEIWVKHGLAPPWEVPDNHGIYPFHSHNCPVGRLLFLELAWQQHGVMASR